MSNTTRKFGFTLIAAMMTLSGFAQNVSPAENTISLDEVRQLRTETEGDSALEEGLRTQVLALLDGAIKLLETAADNRAAAAGFERDRKGIYREVARIRTDLEKPERIPRLPLPENSTVAQAEDALTLERARLAANRAALRDQERVVEDRANLRGDISQRLGELELELELVNDELRRLAEIASRTELNEALRVHAIARREAVSSENNMLRTRLAQLGDRSSLIPLDADLAQRRLSFSLEMVRLLEDATHELRVDQARDMLARIREQSRTLADGLPAVASIAAETEELARTLWDTDGVVARAERTVKSLATTRNHQAQLNRIADLTSRKFEANGHRGSVTRWWPDIPDDFPEPGIIAKIIQDLDEEIPEIESGLILYEQKRSRALQLARETMLQLEDDPDHPLDPDLALAVRDLLTVRQDLLDGLIQRLGQYSNVLVAYRTASASFLKGVEDVERFLYSHILWTRSVPKPVIPRLRDMGQSVMWLISAEHLRSASFVGFPFRGNGIIAALILMLILLLRKPMRRRMKEIAERV
ncbi:MAG: hypothetical protein JRF63_09650, partial [Deltaproteobacteria bacterium]|nr:hypothetical protein [Deltaproteobacteria bacterium]